MLKVEKRKDGRSQYYYIKGTHRFGDEVTIFDGSGVSTGCVKFKDAQKVLNKKINELNNQAQNISNHNFGEATEELLNDPVEKPSYERSKSYEKNQLLLGHIKLKDFTLNLINRYAYERYPALNEWKNIKFEDVPLMKDGEHNPLKLDMSAKFHTLNTHYITPVGRVLHYANTHLKWCPYIKMKKFPILSSDQRPKYNFTVEEIKRCLDTDADAHIKLLFVFLIFTGARLQEALNVEWKHIDLENKTIRLIQGKQNDRPRDVPIHASLEKWLLKINNRESFLFEWRYLDQRKKNKEFGLAHRWNYMLEQAGVSNLKKRHACRHTWATNLTVFADATPQDLMEIGGWKDHRSVMVYSRSDNEDRIRGKINGLPQL